MCYCKIFTQFLGEKSPQVTEYAIFLQNVEYEIFKIFKTFRNNMKFTRAAYWINSKKRNSDKNTTLIIFLSCHYCWSLLWCNYWKSLKSAPTFQNKLVYLLQWKLFKSDEKCILFHLKNSPRSQDIKIFVLTFWSCKKTWFD